MPLRTSAFLVLVAIGVLLTQTPVQPSGMPPIQIVQPLPGTILPSQLDASIVAALGDPFQDPSNFNFIQFTAIKTDGTATFALGRGILETLDAQDVAHIFWPLANVPGGDYTIVAELQDTSGRVFQDTVVVTVHPAPAGNVQIVSQSQVADGVQVTFQATADVSGSGGILQSTWNPGDGSSPQVRPGLGPFTHTYPSMPRGELAFVLTATLEDARGGAEDVQREVVISDAKAEEKKTEDCGCTGMDLLSSAAKMADTTIYCQQPGGAVPPGCARLPNGSGGCAVRPQVEVPYRCAIGPFAPGQTPPGKTTNVGLGWRYEIKASLDPKTNAIDPKAKGACKEGQAVHMTRTRNGAMATPKTAAAAPIPDPMTGGLPFPGAPAGRLLVASSLVPKVTDPDWGADGYVRPSVSKRHDPPRGKTVGMVRWTDAPTVDRFVNGIAANSLTGHLVFVAWVTGNLDTCWCQFEIDQSWTAQGGLKSPPIIKVIAGNHCNQPDKPKK